MLEKECAKALNNMREKSPLVHCITNYVTANTVANGLLAAGASPVMADSPLDAAEITAMSDGVLFNMGTFGKERCKAMLISAGVAAEDKKPVVLDPVGAGSTDYRLKNALQMLRQFRFAAVRGNASEIMALVNASAVTMKVENPALSDLDVNAAEKGVDSRGFDLDKKIALARAASEKFSTVVTVTGKTDVVCCKSRTALIHNGNRMMSKITGTGCLASGLLAAMCASYDDYFISAVAAMSLIGAVGEIAAERLTVNQGTGTLYVNMLDALTVIDEEKFMNYAKIELI